ncbi:MAG TPA: hypothetical protein VFO85_07715, partial [Vicinamibacteria bacterium]|nr:hypothetical protein [Vicinamibacteria bacterium]
MSSLWTALSAEVLQDLTLWILLALVAVGLLARLRTVHEERLLRAPLVLFGLHLTAVAGAALWKWAGSDVYRDVNLLARVFGAICLIQLAAVAIFV